MRIIIEEEIKIPKVEMEYIESFFSSLSIKFHMTEDFMIVDQQKITLDPNMMFEVIANLDTSIEGIHLVPFGFGEFSVINKQG